MRHLIRILIIFSVGNLLTNHCRAYDPPNLDQRLVEPDALLLDANAIETLTEALTSVACNFPSSPVVDSDLRERVIALALSLDPLSVNARNTHKQLSAGTAPSQTSYFKDSTSSLAELFWSTAEKISRQPSEPECRKLALYLKELSLLLHPAPPRSRVNAFKSQTNGRAQPWDTMVSLQRDLNYSSRKLALLFAGEFPSQPTPSRPPAIPVEKPQTTNSSPLVNHLIYLCDFETSDGSVDLSPRKNHGKVTQAKLGSGRSAKSTKALHFASKNDNLALPIDLSPNLIPEATVCLWVKPAEDFKRNVELISQNDRQGLDRAIIIEKKSGKPYMWGVFRGSDGLGLTDAIPVKINDWTFVAATFSHSQVTTNLYIDNRKFEWHGCHGQGTPELYIGNQHPGKEFIGALDDICIFNRVLTPAEIGSIRSGSQFSNLVAASSKASPASLQPDRPKTPAIPHSNSLSEGLIYACNFEESDGTLDQSPAQSHGMAVGGELVAGTAAGQRGYYFDGQKDRIIVGANLRPVERPNLTISLWLKPEEVERNFAIPLSTATAGQRGLQVRRSKEHNNQFMWALQRGAGPPYMPEPVIFDRWTHIAIVYEHAELKGRFYINGKEYSYDFVSPGWGRDFFTLGCSPAFGQHYKGAIDNVLVYERALSSEAIKKLYQTTGKTARFTPPNKITQAGGAIHVRPTYLSNRYPNNRHRGPEFKYTHLLESDNSKGELIMYFDLTKLEAKKATFKKCYLRVKVNGNEVSATEDIITLTSKGVPIASKHGAQLREYLDFEIPVNRINFKEKLSLKLTCGEDELVLDKRKPADPKLVFE